MSYRQLLLERHAKWRESQPSRGGEVLDYLQVRNREHLQAWHQRWRSRGPDGAPDEPRDGQTDRG